MVRSGRGRWKRSSRNLASALRHFVILCPDLEGITMARTAVEQFLKDMGLHLSPSKTRITHTLNRYEGNVGFDFLGFHVQQYPVGQTHTGKDGHGKKLGFKTHIKPSGEAVTRHMQQLNKVMRSMRSATQRRLIGTLNPIIRGWSAYNRTVVASEVFHACDHQLYFMLSSWARRRHPNKNARWRAERYWDMQPGHKWRFAVQGKDQEDQLLDHDDTRITRHVKVQGRASPYDGNIIYWARRL
jgi:RNA-directed DNA polymerase